VTWGELKRLVERAGVRDSDALDRVVIDAELDAGVEVSRHPLTLRVRVDGDLARPGGVPLVRVVHRGLATEARGAAALLPVLPRGPGNLLSISPGLVFTWGPADPPPAERGTP
jgi:hypothetical protein